LVEGINLPIRELVPAKLGEAFQAGEFDAALLSSIDVISAPNPCAVDGVSISSKGDVYSVVLAYEGGLKDGKKVVLDPASHTSNALLRIVLEEFHGIQSEYVQYTDLESLEFPLEYPTLLIGDRAIKTRNRTTSQKVRFLDLGGEWFRHTGLPFVFAVWSLKDDFTIKKEMSDLLRGAKDSGLAHRAELAAREQDPSFALHYLTESIRYDLGDEEKAGLALFGEYLVKCNLRINLNEIVYY